MLHFTLKIKPVKNNLKYNLIFITLHQKTFVKISASTGWEATLDPRPQPKLQTSQKINPYSLKISSMSDSGATFHEPE